MRMTDGIIALPLLPLLIVLAALDLEKLGIPADIAQSESISLYRIIAIVSLVGWTTVARLVRAATLSLRERPFVLAARAQGASAGRIMTVHILPNLASPIIVATTLSVGNVILLESVLSFLGLGHPAAHSQLGEPADKRTGTDLGRARPGDLPGDADLHDGDRLQLLGRWIAGRPGPPLVQRTAALAPVATSTRLPPPPLAARKAVKARSTRLSRVSPLPSRATPALRLTDMGSPPKSI